MRRRAAPQAAQAQARNEISFDDALATLQSMFSEVDPGVITLILESNSGRMETTVEHLLAMTGGGGAASSQSAAKPAGPGPPQYKPPATQSAQKAPPAKHNLPPDFLRPPSYFSGNPASNEASQAAQEEEDLMLAKILQDSLFMAELQKHPEWILEQRKQQKKSQSQPRNWNVGNTGSINNQSSQAEYTRQINKQNSKRYQNFKSKFSSLGASAKAKLASLAQRMKGDKKQEYSALNNPDYHALSSVDDDIEQQNDKKPNGNGGGFRKIE